MRAMQQLNYAKVSTLTMNATIAKAPLKVVDDELNEIPEEYMRQKVTYELDKAKVLEDFKAGKELPMGLSVVQGSYLKVT